MSWLLFFCYYIKYVAFVVKRKSGWVKLSIIHFEIGPQIWGLLSYMSSQARWTTRDLQHKCKYWVEALQYFIYYYFVLGATLNNIIHIYDNCKTRNEIFCQNPLSVAMETVIIMICLTNSKYPQNSGFYGKISDYFMSHCLFYDLITQ